MVQTFKPLFNGGSDSRAIKAGVDQLNAFGWYNMLYNAANGKVELFDTIKAIDALTVFQFLVRKKADTDFQNRLQKVMNEEQKRRRK